MLQPSYCDVNFFCHSNDVVFCIVGAFGFSEFTKDNDTLLATPPLDWPMSFDNATAVSDDDLGFDPFVESKLGLADMLENENGNLMPGYHAGGLVMPPVHSHRPPPGVHLHRNQTGVISSPGVASDMLTTGIMSSIVTPSSPSVLHPSVVCSNASTLPPPPPGLPAFPQYANDVPCSSTTPPLTNSNGPGTSASKFMLSVLLDVYTYTWQLK